MQMFAIRKKSEPIPVNHFVDQGNSGVFKWIVALVGALQENNEDFNLAFKEYNTDFRPFIDEVQDEAVR